MNVPHHTEDPWSKVETVGGLFADEVISAFQKSIRRGDVENAVLCAHEMWRTSSDLEEVLWSRLSVISVEDVGFGLPNAPVIIEALNQARTRSESAHERFLFAVHAVRVLSDAPKDRSSDELTSWITREADRGRLPEIFDAALDMHTRRGQEMGRGLSHFLTEGARVASESADRESRWRELLMDDLESEDG